MPTIEQVLKNPDQYPVALKAQAQVFSDTKSQYTAKAAESARLLVTHMTELTVDDAEAKGAFAKIIDIRAAAVKGCDEAFAIIAGDYPEPSIPVKPVDPAPTPATDPAATPVT